MFPWYLDIVFALACVIGLLLLIRSIYKIVALYNSPNSVDFPATQSVALFELKKTGSYEIALKRPSLFGIMPSKLSLEITALDNKRKVPVIPALNLLSQRRNLSGERVVPLAEFEALNTGSYQLTNHSAEALKENDRLLVTPKTGAKGFALIFAILFSAILFIGGLVLTLLSLLKN